MVEVKKTYGISLNPENEDDLALMRWLEGMERGGPSRAIRDGLIQQRQIEQGKCECVPVGTWQQLQDALGEIEGLRRQLEQRNISAPSVPSLDPAALTKAIADGVAQGINRAGLTGISTNGNGSNGHHPVDDEREDPDDELVRRMAGMKFDDTTFD